MKSSNNSTLIEMLIGFPSGNNYSIYSTHTNGNPQLRELDVKHLRLFHCRSTAAQRSHKDDLIGHCSEKTNKKKRNSHSL